MMLSWFMILLEHTFQGMESMIALATVLRQNKFMTSLNVGRSLPFIEQEETTVHMGLMLRVNNSLRELHLTKCAMRDFGVERLADGLFENTALRYLNLSWLDRPSTFFSVLFLRVESKSRSTSNLSQILKTELGTEISGIFL